MAFRGPKTLPPNTPSTSGQAVVLVSVMIASFLLFFGFVINTGILITAKISLQTAADTAAYSGAAVQARQMSAISWLNTDLRQQFKKFLFRYTYVTSLAKGDLFTTGKLGNGPVAQFLLRRVGNNAQPEISIGAPEICIPIPSARGNALKNSNTCQTADIASTASKAPERPIFLQGSVLIQSALDAIQRLENLQQELCTAEGALNDLISHAWLYRTDTSAQALDLLLNKVPTYNALPLQEKTAVNGFLSGISAGLGLVPRNSITEARIQTLQSFIETPSQTDMDADRIFTLKSARGAERFERTVLAFESAAANLNENIFQQNELKLTEIMGDPKLPLETVRVDFDVLIRRIDRGTRNTSSPETSYCKAQLVPFPVKAVPVAIRRSQLTQIAYAVKLSAPVKLFFLPGQVELQAVAAAHPFGSRIGPQEVKPADFRRQFEPGNRDILAIHPTTSQPVCTGNDPCFIPKLPVVPGAANQEISTLHPAFIRNLFRNGRDPQNTQFADVVHGQNIFKLPYTSEIGRFNFLPAPKTDPEFPLMGAETVPYTTKGEPNIFRVYAPIIPDQGGDPATLVASRIRANFPQTQVGIDPIFKINFREFGDSIAAGIGTYIGKIQTPGTDSENGESVSFAAIELPLAGANPNLPPSPKNVYTIPSPDPALWVTDPSKLMTSWAPNHGIMGGGQRGFKGRFGYSVKLIGIQRLRSMGITIADDTLDTVKH